MQDKVTIDQALDAFLADQRCRLSARTLRNYDDVVDLLRGQLALRAKPYHPGL